MNRTRWKLATAKATPKAKVKSKCKGAKPDRLDKECHVCGKKLPFARDCWSRAKQDRTVNEAECAKVDSDAATEFVFTIENIVKDVSLSQSGCEGHRDGLVMIDSGAAVNVFPSGLENLFLRIRRISSTPRCGRKDTPRLRKVSNLVKNRKPPETM